MEVRLLAAALLAAGVALAAAAPPQTSRPAPPQPRTDGIPVAPVVEGSASGALTVNGARRALTHAYAIAQPGAFDKSTEDTRVLLSDRALSDEAREDTFALIDLARAGRVQVVEVLIDATGTPIGGAFYGPAFDGMISATGMHKFTRERLDAHGVAGRLWTDGASSFRDVTYQYDVRFDAPIPRPPSPEAIAAALASPPARAAQRYLDALRQGTFASFAATLTTTLAADFAGAEGEARFRQLRADMPADARVSAVVAAKAPDADAILVTLEGHQDGVAIDYVLKLRLIDGAWKVDR